MVHLIKTARRLAALSAAATMAGALCPILASGIMASYRMYNPNSGEHFYTHSAEEKKSLFEAGWWYEGVSWYTADAGAPVFRLYNPKSGEHHYTLSDQEQQTLKEQGWRAEGAAFYSADFGVPVYRLFNPKALRAEGSHHYTTSPEEVSALKEQGWKDEGIGWYVAKEGQLLAEPEKPVLPSPVENPSTPAPGSSQTPGSWQPFTPDGPAS